MTGGALRPSLRSLYFLANEVIKQVDLLCAQQEATRHNLRSRLGFDSLSEPETREDLPCYNENGIKIDQATFYPPWSSFWAAG